MKLPDGALGEMRDQAFSAPNRLIALANVPTTQLPELFRLNWGRGNDGRIPRPGVFRLRAARGAVEGSDNPTVGTFSARNESITSAPFV